MAHDLLTSAVLAAAVHRDGAVKAAIFWLIIVALIAGVAFAVRRRRRTKRSPISDEWRPGSTSSGADATKER